jgi:hypothetical protein
VEEQSAFRERDLGRRLALIRRQVGIRTAQELADAIPNERMTGVVIRNIESGRKPDLSVSQLMDLSAALRVHPIALMVPLGRPSEPVTLPNAGDTVAGMRVVDLVRWIGVGRGYTSQPEGNVFNFAVQVAAQNLIHLEQQILNLHQAVYAAGAHAPDADPDPYLRDRADAAIRDLKETLRALTDLGVEARPLVPDEDLELLDRHAD